MREKTRAALSMLTILGGFSVALVHDTTAVALVEKESTSYQYDLTYAETLENAQDLSIPEEAPKQIISRDNITVEAPPEPAPATAQAPIRASMAPGDLDAAQAYASSQVGGGEEWNCLYQLWAKESGWRWNAGNPGSNYGIPQAVPGTKMASAGADWETNYETQINWGLGYINGRYGSACGAWNHSINTGWY